MLDRLFLAALLGLSACAPSPLYVGSKAARTGDAEVPRDGQGEPVWSAIKPVPVPTNTSQPPILPTDVGVIPAPGPR